MNCVGNSNMFFVVDIFLKYRGFSLWFVRMLGVGVGGVFFVLRFFFIFSYFF